MQSKNESIFDIITIISFTYYYAGLNNLEVLHLDLSLFDNAITIMPCLDGLSSLKSLTLAYMGDVMSFHGEARPVLVFFLKKKINN